MSNQELMEVRGGFKWGVLAIISAAVSFVLGVLDGVLNPEENACKKGA